MISAGIRELKNNLSRYLSRVKNGEDILITERGKAIARIIRENPEEIHLREVLSPLIVKGLSRFLQMSLSTSWYPGAPTSTTYWRF